MVTTAVVFDHRSAAKRNGTGPVEVRVTIDRKNYYVQTGVKILRSEFLSGTIINRMDAEELNNRVNIIHKRVVNAINDCLEQNVPIIMNEIREKVWNMNEAKRDSSMIDWCESQMPLLGLNPNTLRHYSTLILRLREYGKMTRWADLTVENLYEWNAWLHRLPGWDGKLISDAAVYNYHKCMKALISRAVRMRVISENPYNSLRGAFKRGDRETVEYLTEDEMKRIETMPVAPGSIMEKARDLFVFQMYTGLSYSDAMNFDIRNYRMEDGMLTAIGQRVKTGVSFISRILPPAAKVLEKYGYKVPYIHNTEYNRALKSIGVVAGITSKLHSHMARHTFATWMLSNGVSLDSVSVMVGHTNIIQTRRYAKTLASSVRKDFDRIAEKMKEKTP